VPTTPGLPRSSGCRSPRIRIRWRWTTVDAAAVGPTSEGQGPRPAGEPGATAGTSAVNDDPCRASKARKGPDKNNKLNAATSQAPVEAASDADNVTSQCQNFQPDGTEGDGQESISRPTTMGGGRAASRPRMQGASPARDRRNHLPISGGGSPEKGRPPETGPRAGPVARRARRAEDRDRCDSGQRNPPARALALAGLGLSVTSCQDDEVVIEKDGDPGTARQRVVAVKAPHQRAKLPFSRRSEDADGDRQCGRSAHADYR
jgi:hypothetical protein